MESNSVHLMMVLIHALEILTQDLSLQNLHNLLMTECLMTDQSLDGDKKNHYFVYSWIPSLS